MSSIKLSVVLLATVAMLAALFVIFQGGPSGRNEVLAPYIGKKFEALDLIDTTSKQATLQFDKSELTIVDFWFSDCPGCLKDMKKFDEALVKRKDVQIASVSINSYAHWKALFHSGKPAYGFLKTANPSWQHYALHSKEDPRLKNDIPMDNYSLVAGRYKTHSYPAYFVVDRTGTIVETPVSAVDYLEEQLSSKK